MQRKISDALQQWFAAGHERIGQVSIKREGAGFSLTHQDDVERDDLSVSGDPEEANEISKFDDAGNYRPLKSAPNLRRGWRLVVADVEQLRLALDLLYPAMLGALLACEGKRLRPVPFRETANRQTGMYQSVRKITDAQADELIGDFCRSDGNCLKTILWQIDSGRPLTTLPPEKFDPTVNQTRTPAPAIPLLCSEACGLLISAARDVVKSSRSK